MSEVSRTTVFREVIRQRMVRFGVPLWVFIAGYDGISSQLDLYKISELWGISGELLPWWGWLLILESILLLALFEYLRKIPAPATTVHATEARLQGRTATEERPNTESERDSGERKRLHLTTADREAVGELIRDISNFVGGELHPFFDELASANGGDPVPMIKACVELQGVPEGLIGRVKELSFKHAHYLQLTGIDLEPMLRALAVLRGRMKESAAADGWPADAQKDRATATVHALNDVGGTLWTVKLQLTEVRKAYLDVG